MLEEKSGRAEPAKKAKATKKRAKQQLEAVAPENAEDEYNYLNDESAIRVGGEGVVTPPFSENMEAKDAQNDEEFPEDDVDPIVYMGLVNRPK